MFKSIDWIFSLIKIFLSNPISIVSIILIVAMGLLISKFTNKKVFVFYYVICFALALVGFCGAGNLYLILMFVPSTVALTIMLLIFVIAAIIKKRKNKRQM